MILLNPMNDGKGWRMVVNHFSKFKDDFEEFKKYCKERDYIVSEAMFEAIRMYYLTHCNYIDDVTDHCYVNLWDPCEGRRMVMQAYAEGLYLDELRERLRRCGYKIHEEQYIALWEMLEVHAIEMVKVIVVNMKCGQ